MGVSWLPHSWFCLMFKRDESFPYMVVNTNPWKVRFGKNRGISSNRGMSQLVWRMLKDSWKGASLSPFPLSSLLPFTPTLPCSLSPVSLVYGRVSDSCVLQPVHIMKTQDKNVYKHILCHNAHSSGLNGGNLQQQLLLNLEGSPIRVYWLMGSQAYAVER